MERNCSLTPVTLLNPDLISAGQIRFEPSEFATFLRQHQGMVFSLACHFLRDRAMAEEVAQEVFLRLYQNLASMESTGHMVRWLRKVTWRLCIDEVRRRPNLKPMSLDEISEPAAAQPTSDPLLAEKLRRLVADLPETARMAVILRYQEDMDIAEIAGILDLPINTVKSRLHRGLMLLRKKLARQPGGTEK